MCSAGCLRRPRDSGASDLVRMPRSGRANVPRFGAVASLGREVGLPFCGYARESAAIFVLRLRHVARLHQLLAQRGFQDLAGRIAGKRGEKVNFARHLVVGQPVAHKMNQRLFLDPNTFLRCDESHWMLALS